MHAIKVSDVRRTVQPGCIPNGEFSGVWSGYEVTWATSDGMFIGKTENGIRGHNIPCEVIVNGDDVTVGIK